MLASDFLFKDNFLKAISQCGCIFEGYKSLFFDHKKSKIDVQIIDSFDPGIAIELIFTIVVKKVGESRDCISLLQKLIFGEKLLIDFYAIYCNKDILRFISLAKLDDAIKKARIIEAGINSTLKELFNHVEKFVLADTEKLMEFQEQFENYTAKLNKYSAFRAESDRTPKRVMSI